VNAFVQPLAENLKKQATNQLPWDLFCLGSLIRFACKKHQNDNINAFAPSTTSNHHHPKHKHG